MRALHVARLSSFRFTNELYYPRIRLIRLSRLYLILTQLSFPLLDMRHLYSNGFKVKNLRRR